MKRENGFTIVELLIVIVVIGILAAIVIVAYQGVTARANTSKAQTNAVSVQKKAEAYAADSDAGGGNGSYPGTVTAFTAVTSDKLGALPAGINLVATAIGTTAPTNANTVRYVSCGGAVTTGAGATGYYVSYFNYGTKVANYIVGGTASTTAVDAAPTCPATPSTT